MTLYQKDPEPVGGDIPDGAVLATVGDGTPFLLVPVEPDGFVTVAEDAEWVPRFTSFIAPVPEGRYALVRIGGGE